MGSIEAHSTSTQKPERPRRRHRWRRRAGLSCNRRERDAARSSSRARSRAWPVNAQSREQGPTTRAQNWTPARNHSSVSVPGRNSNGEQQRDGCALMTSLMHCPMSGPSLARGWRGEGNGSGGRPTQAAHGCAKRAPAPPSQGRSRWEQDCARLHRHGLGRRSPARSSPGAPTTRFPCCVGGASLAAAAWIGTPTVSLSRGYRKEHAVKASSYDEGIPAAGCAAAPLELHRFEAELASWWRTLPMPRIFAGTTVKV